MQQCRRNWEDKLKCVKIQNTKWNILAHSGTRTINFEIYSVVPYRLSYLGFDESRSIKVAFIHTCTSNTNIYVGISSRKIKWSVFCLAHLLYCVTLGYTVKPVYNGHSMEKQKVAVAGRWPLYRGSKFSRSFHLFSFIQNVFRFEGISQRIVITT